MIFQEPTTGASKQIPHQKKKKLTRKMVKLRSKGWKEISLTCVEAGGMWFLVGGRAYTKAQRKRNPEVQEDQGTERSSKTSKTLTSIIIQGQHLVFQVLAHKLKLPSIWDTVQKKGIQGGESREHRIQALFLVVSWNSFIFVPIVLLICLHNSS